MPPPVKHHSKSKVGRRRSHLAKKKISISVCKKCGRPTIGHKACPSCGFYGETE
ncbi:MAG: 50S ribosomal protein L32 [Candidatus Colwellbacteria bacterium]|nr:50S ribosomal protein L32 [Candidatus Colwellbacteria bacterium]